MPYVNSVGEKYRIRQLLHQLPPHDNEVSDGRRRGKEMAERGKGKIMMEIRKGEGNKGGSSKGLKRI